MIFLYQSRYNFFKGIDELDLRELKEERLYTKRRIIRKKRSRRWYTYSLIIFSTLGVSGIFSINKGVIIASCIPIVLIAGLEFGIGLLTEWRLVEYLRQLDKNI